MFARRVYLRLKPNSVAEFTQRLEKDILPLLRKQKGFQDEITFVGQGGTDSCVCHIHSQGKRLHYVNQAAVAITGYAREELLSMNFWDLVHPALDQLHPAVDRSLGASEGTAQRAF